MTENTGGRKKKGRVTIIGAGRSGRGMLGELYDRDGFFITFADVKDELVDGLREQGFYTVKMTDIKKGISRERCIEGFSILHADREKEAYLEALIHSDIVSTALLPGDFDAVIGDLAAAVRLRRREGIHKPLCITLGANYVGLYEYFEKGLKARLEGEDVQYFDSCICLAESIVNRKNFLPPADRQGGDRWRIEGDNKEVLRVEDREGFRKLPHVPSFFRLEKNLGAAMAVKLWSGNLVQCSMAFVALKDGLKDTAEASRHEKASEYAFYAASEGYRAVAAEYGLPPRTEAEDREPVGIFRSPGFSDSLYRIAREPARKLGREERFIGPALLCVRHGILPYYITKCLAYGFLYSRKEEPQSLEVRKWVEEKGIENAVEHFCGLDRSAPGEKLIWELTVNAYREIDGVNPMDAEKDRCETEKTSLEETDRAKKEGGES